MEWTNGLWTFNGESKKKIGHPAPFPRELPYRCIKLFSYVNDLVFDPFCGSGTTLIEAYDNNRRAIGVELDLTYCKLARDRITKEIGSLVCGLGREHGLEIHVDHIKPKDLGGKAEISNGQTLCAIHNFRKKNYGQTETGKKMFIRLYEASKSIGDEKTMAFCQEVLEVYDQCNINGHIKWEK
jgi:hypothetical protein